MNWKTDWLLNFIFLFLTYKGNISLPPLQLGWGPIIRFCQWDAAEVMESACRLSHKSHCVYVLYSHLPLWQL